MAISYIGATYTITSYGYYHIANKPNSTSDGDIMFAFICGRNPDSAPSGWTLLGTNENYALYYKIASSEGSSYQWTTPINTTLTIGIFTYRGGFDSSDPIDTLSNTSYLTNDNIIRAASINITKTGSALIVFGGFYYSLSTSFTPPTNPGTFTEDYEQGAQSLSYLMDISHYTWDSNGATGNMDITASRTRDQKHAFAVALNPVITPGPLNLKTYNTNPRANIKTINGNPIANVKSLDTNI